MSRSIQLVLLCVVTLSYIQLGTSDCDTESMNRIENSISTLRSELTSAKMSLSQQIYEQAAYSCGGTGGWRHAVYLDMTDPNTNCPSGWNMTDYSKRTCGRATDGTFTCDSVTFPVNGGEYSQVCGRIRAYQYGGGGGFHGSYVGRNSVDDAYFSGVAVMHGNPRQHIWSFVAGAAENQRSDSSGLCPCDSLTDRFRSIPPFVGEDYFCESGYISGSGPWRQFHSDDILWDGRDCHSRSTCCSLHNPPYFTKALTSLTTDDIELRMCLFGSVNETYVARNVAVELVELYVK